MSGQNDSLVVIPVLNEEKSVGGVIDMVKENVRGVDILIVDDGSSDGTLEIACKKDVFVVSHPFNMGIGSSFQTGCLFAENHGYRSIVRMDGDGQHAPEYLDAILAPVKNGNVDIAIGSRFLGKSKFKSSMGRLVGIYIISRVLMIITRKPVTDPTSGFCAMNKKAFAFFSENCADDYPEPDILMHHKEFRITEVPISISRRSRGVSSISPLKSVYYMCKVLFSLFVGIFR